MLHADGVVAVRPLVHPRGQLVIVVQDRDAVDAAVDHLGAQAAGRRQVPELLRRSS